MGTGKLSFSIITVKIASGKNHQYLLNIGESFDEEKNIRTVLNLSTDYLLVVMEKEH